MCLTILNTVDQIPVSKAIDLPIGTWFTDTDQQVYLIVNDDQKDDPMIVCVGDFYRPFVVYVPLREFEVYQVLEMGCTLQITRSAEEGFHAR